MLARGVPVDTEGTAESGEGEYRTARTGIGRRNHAAQMTHHPTHTIRGSIAFGCMCNAALSVVLARETLAQTHFTTFLWEVMLAVLAAVGLLVYGQAQHELLGHDWSDASGGAGRRDRRSRPNIIATSLALIIALFAALGIGGDAVAVAVVLAALLLFYNVAARYIPAIGLLMPGGMIAGVMLIPDWKMPIPVVVWFAMTQATAAAIAVYVLGDRRPRLSQRAAVVVLVGYVLMSGVVLSLRSDLANPIWPSGVSLWALAWPVGCTLMLGVVLRWKVAAAPSRPEAAIKIARYVALWQPLIGSAWCAGTQDWWAAGAFAAAGLAGLLFVGGYRELAGMSGPPPDWR